MDILEYWKFKIKIWLNGWSYYGTMKPESFMGCDKKNVKVYKHRKFKKAVLCETGWTGILSDDGKIYSWYQKKI